MDTSEKPGPTKDKIVLEDQNTALAVQALYSIELFGMMQCNQPTLEEAAWNFENWSDE